MASNGAEFPINGGTYPPFGVITDDNHGSYVIVATWIFACISVLFVMVRVVLRTWTSHHFGWDNGLIIAALCFDIGESIATSESVKFGLGRHLNDLGNDEIRSYHRSIFASDILSVFVFVLSKLSLVALIGHLTPSNNIRIILRWFTLFTILWGISDVFSVAFQCGTGVPMETFDNFCVNQKALLFSHGIINILTDFVLVILLVFILWRVHIGIEQKLIVLGLFWARTAVCVVAGIRLSTMKPYISGEDSTWNYLYPSLWNQITTHLSVITACIPSIQPFFDSLQSSLIDSGIPRKYTSNNLSIELRPWRTSKKNLSRSPRTFQSSLRGMGLTSTTHNEIQGGVTSDNASTRRLTDSVIHQQREVDVVIADASQELSEPKSSDTIQGTRLRVSSVHR